MRNMFSGFPLEALSVAAATGACAGSLLATQQAVTVPALGAAVVLGVSFAMTLRITAWVWGVTFGAKADSRLQASISS